MYPHLSDSVTHVGTKANANCLLGPGGACLSFPVWETEAGGTEEFRACVKHNTLSPPHPAINKVGEMDREEKVRTDSSKWSSDLCTRNMAPSTATNKKKSELMR